MIHGDCGICLSSYDWGDEIVTLPCFHRYHSEWVGRWFREKNRAVCPVWLAEDEQDDSVRWPTVLVGEPPRPRQSHQFAPPPLENDPTSSSVVLLLPEERDVIEIELDPPVHQRRTLPPALSVQREVGAPSQPPAARVVVSAPAAPLVIDLRNEIPAADNATAPQPPSEQSTPPPRNAERRIRRRTAGRRGPHRRTKLPIHRPVAQQRASQPPTSRQLDIAWARDIARKSSIHTYKSGDLKNLYHNCYICKRYKFNSEHDFLRHVRSKSHLIQFYKLDPRKCHVCPEIREFNTPSLWSDHLASNRHKHFNQSSNSRN